MMRSSNAWYRALIGTEETAGSQFLMNAVGVGARGLFINEMKLFRSIFFRLPSRLAKGANGWGVARRRGTYLGGRASKKPKQIFHELKPKSIQKMGDRRKVRVWKHVSCWGKKGSEIYYGWRGVGRTMRLSPHIVGMIH